MASARKRAAARLFDWLLRRSAAVRSASLLLLLAPDAAPSVAAYVAAVLLLLLAPLQARKTFTDENALLPGARPIRLALALTAPRQAPPRSRSGRLMLPTPPLLPLPRRRSSPSVLPPSNFALSSHSRRQRAEG